MFEPIYYYEGVGGAAAAMPNSLWIQCSSQQVQTCLQTYLQFEYMQGSGHVFCCLFARDTRLQCHVLTGLSGCCGAAEVLQGCTWLALRWW